RGIDPRPLEAEQENISLSQEETFPRDVTERARLHEELRRMAVNLAELLVRTGQSARTVTTKLRYPDFTVRSRSQALAVGIRDGDRIGELACALLDRALVDRPGALRLVGGGVSSREGVEQLELGATHAPPLRRSA